MILMEIYLLNQHATSSWLALLYAHVQLAAIPAIKINTKANERWWILLYAAFVPGYDETSTNSSRD